MIPAIPKAEQRLITELDIDEAVPVLDVVAERCMERLKAGAEGKYGPSWNEVNLKADLEEELLDVINYSRLMLMRVTVAEQLGLELGEHNRVAFLATLAEIISHTEMVLLLLDSGVPDFEGPTSNEWAEDG